MASPTFSFAKPHYAVAGAGAFGLACAVALARRGMAVTVCDPAAVGDNASGVAAGMLAPALESLLDAPSAEHFGILAAARAAWPAFAAANGLTLDRSGALWVGPDAEDIEARLQARGAQARQLSAAEARAAVPGLTWDGAAVFTPEDWSVDTTEALIGLRAAAERLGVRFVTDAVTGWSGAEAVLESGERLAADGLVVAVGAATLDLAPELAALTPVKGHILRMHAGPHRGPVVRGEGVYIRPHSAGAIVGASMEVGRSDRVVDPAVAADLAARAALLFPQLGAAAYLAAAGVRASTADGLPLVGPSVVPGVLLAVGARRNGWLLAPSVAEAIADLATGERPTPLAAAMAPDRKS